ncbi:MAG: ABC transporter ATP-binding protein [Candidatus Cloacimonetes bacterium]|jgi:ABC-type lipoprotein export system ATPase subunit|nr:ABC transporter ATP-binding protein [Candidatus Cloacimonadota bacterium]MBT6994761.1 ABC transporter ATP-binding protein [Candidatus Cloacimonadota bacterium]MBT7469459.1 ABC transporter ATP-binding protein [Candidatus Cloacimonadota bacterium]
MVIEIANVDKIYHSEAEKIHALKDISLKIEEGEFISIMGHSGAGKTTLLNLLGCLDGISNGKLKIMKKDLDLVKKKDFPKFRRDNIGIIFQDFLFVPTLTALENVMLPLHFKRKKDANAEKKAKNLLTKVGLEKRINHFPRELSGGEMQRVAIARALVNEPKILLADEPTGNLDTKNAQNIFDLLKEINAKEKMTILVATHNKKLGKQAKRHIHIEDGSIKEDSV